MILSADEPVRLWRPYKQPSGEIQHPLVFDVVNHNYQKPLFQTESEGEGRKPFRSVEVDEVGNPTKKRLESRGANYSHLRPLIKGCHACSQTGQKGTLRMLMPKQIIITFMFTVSCYSFAFPLVRKADISEFLYRPLLFPSWRPPFAVLALELIVLARSA